jgi:hypothetical protein
MDDERRNILAVRVWVTADADEPWGVRVVEVRRSQP